MTKEAIDFIQQMQYKQAEIDQLEQELESLKLDLYEYGTDGVSGSSKKLPYAKHNITVAGFYQSPRVLNEIKKYGAKLQDSLEKLYIAHTEAENIISEITDSKARTIIRYRYIDGLSWQKIADRLTDSDTENSVRMYAERFLKKLL